MEASPIPAKDLFAALGAVWGFYGTTLLALLGFVAFPSAPREITSQQLRWLLRALTLFLALNWIAIAGLQSYLVHLAGGAGPACLFNGVLLLFHAALDYSALRVVRAFHPVRND